ncbi:DoxX family protein [Alcanivorax sp. DP30]|uniref:HvfX family Cu-binding RiPP maturation protein n=1 Tax=Alcanivorax sp. DP30 TaxID=2606217 RepID=UPI001370164E|nr:DoxX family protein [Alcanivorax sp. DP30]MZR61561.1 DoxX family membrane protein [Alcanivorax sp. DP30]
MPALLHKVHHTLNTTRLVDFLAPLALRLFLAPVMISAGYNKAMSFESTVAWFGNPDWGLGLPAPALLAFVATATELVGGFLLLIGLFTRYISIPLMFTMLVAMATVHWDNGWFAVAPGNPETSMAAPLAKVGFPGAMASLENSEQVGERIQRARGILKEHGHYGWLTEKGSFVVLNNGIEFAMTYFIMLLVLFFQGGGRYLSLDYWVARKLLLTQTV